MHSAALECLVFPARLRLDSVVGEQGVFDSVVPVGKGSFCLNEPREIGTLVAYLDGSLHSGKSCRLFLRAKSLFLFQTATSFLFGKSLCLRLLGESLFSCEASFLGFALEHFAVELFVRLESDNDSFTNAALVLGELLSVIHKSRYRYGLLVLGIVDHIVLKLVYVGCRVKLRRVFGESALGKETVSIGVLCNAVVEMRVLERYR